MVSDKTEKFLQIIRTKLSSECNDDINLNMTFLEQAIRLAQKAFDDFQWIFFTYTDHKITHARNVIRLMYELLEQMNVLEQKLSLSSDNRPDVHVSRDGSAAFPLRTLSMLNYGFRSAVRSLTKNNRHFRHIYDTITLPPILCSLDKIPSCSTIMEVDGIEKLWLDERIIPTSLGRMSISEIQKHVSDYGEIRLMNIFSSKHIVSIIGTYLIQKYLKVKARFHNRKIEFVAFGSSDPKNCDVVLQDLPCFFFMEYEGTDHLRVENSPYNINHPLSQTVIQLIEEVKRTDNDQLNGYLQLLLNCLGIKYNTPDMLNQNLVIPVNQILAEIGSSNKISDRDFIINPEYGFELSKELGFL